MLDYFRDKLKTKDAFSTAEMLLVLLIISFLVLAMPPLIHKKFEKNLRRAEHGRYECWRDAATGNVYEFVATEKQGPLEPSTMTGTDPVTGKRIPKGANRGTDGRCRFDAQKYAPNAAFFSMQAIGGGAGGSYPIWDGTDKYIKDNYTETRPVKLYSHNYDYDHNRGGTDSKHYSYKPMLESYSNNEATKWVAEFFTPVVSNGDAIFCSARGESGAPGVNVPSEPLTKKDEYGTELNPLEFYTELKIGYGGPGGKGICYKAPAGKLAIGGWYTPVRLYTEDKGWDIAEDFGSAGYKNFNYNYIEKDFRFIGGASCYYYSTKTTIPGTNNKSFIGCWQGQDPGGGNTVSSNSLTDIASNPSEYYILMTSNSDYFSSRLCSEGGGYKDTCKIAIKIDSNVMGKTEDIQEYTTVPLPTFSYRCSKTNTPGTYGDNAKCPQSWEDSANNIPEPNYYIRAQYYNPDEPNGLAWTYCKVYPGSKGEDYVTGKSYGSDETALPIYPGLLPRAAAISTPASGNMNGMVNTYGPSVTGKTLHLCDNDIWVNYDNPDPIMKSTAFTNIFPENITMNQVYSYNTPTYGFAGTPGELATQMLPKFDGKLEITLGNAGKAGGKDADTDIFTQAGENGTDTVVWLKSRNLEDAIVCDNNTPGCKYILTGKGGISIPGGNMGPRIKLKGSHTCKITNEDGSVGYNTGIHRCLDTGVATINEAKQRYAVDSGFRTIPEFDKKTKTPSALSVMYDGDRDFNPGSGGDGGYSFVAYMNGTPNIYSSYTSSVYSTFGGNSNQINYDALKAIYGEEYLGDEGIENDASGRGITYGGDPVNDIPEKISNYQCYTRFDGDNDIGTGDAATDYEDDDVLNKSKIKVCKPKSGTPGAVVIVW